MIATLLKIAAIWMVTAAMTAAAFSAMAQAAKGSAHK
jgi:hypothetical protein